MLFVKLTIRDLGLSVALAFDKFPLGAKFYSFFSDGIKVRNFKNSKSKAISRFNSRFCIC